MGLREWLAYLQYMQSFVSSQYEPVLVESFQLNEDVLMVILEDGRHFILGRGGVIVTSRVQSGTKLTLFDGTSILFSDLFTRSGIEKLWLWQTAYKKNLSCEEKLPRASREFPQVIAIDHVVMNTFFGLAGASPCKIMTK